MIKGAAVITIEKPPAVVFDAVTDVSRMGEWSPECTGGRWLPPADGPAVGARFEGHNVARIGPIPVKKWTTTSEVIGCVPGARFEFVTGEGHTRWQYEFIEIDGATRVTESFEHPDHIGFRGFLYEKVLKRSRSMVAGMEATLARLKETLEQ